MLLFRGCSSENTNLVSYFKFVDETEVPAVFRPVKTCCSSHAGVSSSNYPLPQWRHTVPAWQPYNRMQKSSPTQHTQKRKHAQTQLAAKENTVTQCAFSLRVHVQNHMQTQAYILYFCVGVQYVCVRKTSGTSEVAC